MSEPEQFTTRLSKCDAKCEDGTACGSQDGKYVSAFKWKILPEGEELPPVELFDGIGPSEVTYQGCYDLDAIREEADLTDPVYIDENMTNEVRRLDSSRVVH